ncbi:MAG: nuclear transport factor 2 family protein [Sphingobacteriales bacterium]|nr:MAG: nuclear transport factor 2 family protein [Sphingobacteriales bacterium]
MIALIFTVLASCNKVDSEGEKNIAAAKGMFAAFNNHNWEKMASFYTDTAEFLDPAFGQAYVRKTQPETAKKYAEMHQMFQDIKDDITGVTAAGDRVVVQFTSSGTPGGAAKWELPICSILTFKDGKIIKDATYYDNQ